jgi:GT2 family glycosyltransferase
MKVHILKPYSVEKNLGRAYNEAISLIPDGDWACLMDYDTMFLTPDCGKILHDYADIFPNTGMFTCFTNRIHPLSTDQLYKGTLINNTDIQYHITLADEAKKNLYKATKLQKVVSGFLMMIKKDTWKDIKFTENRLCLGVDNDYCARLMDNGRSILRMDGMYVWHSYRLQNGIHNKEHLK